jgi:hypothetical protein
VSYKATAWAYDLPLRGAPKPVLVALADMADEAASCYPGQDRLSSMTGLSVKTVSRAIARLEALGLLKRERRFDAFGHRTSDRYHLQLTVSLPESLTDNLPTRQSAYKAESPSLPDSLSIPTGLSDGVTIREPLEEPSGGRPQSPTCGKHPGGTTRPCRACGDARRLWEASRTAEVITIPRRSSEPEFPEHEHRWMGDGTCLHCTERKGVTA